MQQEEWASRTEAKLDASDNEDVVVSAEAHLKKVKAVVLQKLVPYNVEELEKDMAGLISKVNRSSIGPLPPCYSPSFLKPNSKSPITLAKATLDSAKRTSGSHSKLQLLIIEPLPKVKPGHDLTPPPSLIKQVEGDRVPPRPRRRTPPRFLRRTLFFERMRMAGLDVPNAANETEKLNTRHIFVYMY
ncbi:hypothetical protein RJT34_12185 [Clitoria ternatea]|uniref:Uncharacterized protein n=1 Tax=Clitoria ternatea TaxID=43366 RepID=A0AAN9PKP9_CLITE